VVSCGRGDREWTTASGYRNSRREGRPLEIAFTWSRDGWSDPDFDASESAFYYVRVMEIPIPRWTTHDAKFFGVELPDNVPASIQERAYTSPIWYTP